MFRTTTLQKNVKQLKNALIATAFVGIQLLVPLSASGLLGAKAAATPAGKVFVCKYVGTPGDDERLQTGNNPISVSINSIKDYSGIGSYFNDAQGRSYVLALDNGDEPGQQGEPDVSECPAPDTGTPDQEVAIPATPSVTDPCGEANATWVVPTDTTSVTWTLVDGDLVAHTTTGYVFTDNTTEHDYGTASDSNSACPTDGDDEQEPKKVLVCKYVGTPGIDERLKDGKNPISVSVNAIAQNQWDGTIPGWFSDAHDRSYVLAYDEGQEVDASQCPTPAPTEVEPTAPSFVDPTCENSMGSYTIPEVAGVQYKVDGSVVAAGEYQAVKGTSVTITAEATDGYVLAEEVTTSWSHDFSIEGGCVLGDNDVCPNLAGSQTSVPAGYTTDAAGNCVKPNEGKVLGATTELPNTGASAILNVIAGTAIIVLAVGTRFVSRRNYAKS